MSGASEQSSANTGLEPLCNQNGHAPASAASSDDEAADIVPTRTSSDTYPAYRTSDEAGFSGRAIESHSNPLGRTSALIQRAITKVQLAEGDDSTWLSRVRTKSEELRKIFNLPETENLRDDYMCALKKRILLQGRMYVFESYVCFYTYLLGYNKKKVIPMDAVVHVKKKRNVGFPNSVEVLWRSGAVVKKEFFTSFLSRDEAYRNIMLSWNKASPMARLVNEAVLPATQHSPSAAPKDHVAATALVAASMQGGVDPANVRRSSTGSSQRGEGEDAWPGQAEGSVDVTGAETMSDGESVEEDAAMCSVPEPAPALPPDLQLLLSSEAPFPLSAFVQLVVHRESDFFKRWHESRADKDVVLGSWGSHPRMGCVRELQFVSPVKNPYRFGPPETRCHQTQRYCLYSGSEHLVFETSQVMLDIPYGDCFSVECRWDVTPLPGNAAACRVACHVKVPFSRTCLWRKPIEKHTVDNTRIAYIDLMDKLRAEACGPSPSCPPRASTPTSKRPSRHKPVRAGQQPNPSPPQQEGGATHSPTPAPGRDAESSVGGQSRAADALLSPRTGSRHSPQLLPIPSGKDSTRHAQAPERGRRSGAHGGGGLSGLLAALRAALSEWDLRVAAVALWALGMLLTQVLILRAVSALLLTSHAGVSEAVATAMQGSLAELQAKVESLSEALARSGAGGAVD